VAIRPGFRVSFRCHPAIDFDGFELDIHVGEQPGANFIVDLNLLELTQLIDVLQEARGELDAPIPILRKRRART
jgi:hypothetical protein